MTVSFPQILKELAKKYEESIKLFLSDAFGFNGSIEEAINKVMQLFSDFGIDMYFHGDFQEGKLDKIPNKSSFTKEQIIQILKNSLKKIHF